jgi:hypothetical protein
MLRVASTMMFLAVLLAAPLGAQGAAKEPQGIPSAHRPPPGMCRIWIDGVPPERQPAPTDCATAIRRRPPNARVVFGDDYRETPRRTLVPAAPPNRDNDAARAERERADRERADRERAEAERAARDRQQRDKHERDRPPERTPPPRREAHPRDKPPFGGG